MDTEPTTHPASYTPAAKAPDIFKTRVPMAVAFSIGILLFLLPFAEIKCGETTVMNKSGLDIALGNDWKTITKYDRASLNDTVREKATKKEGSAQLFTIIALGLALLGLGLSFTSPRMAGVAGIITGVLSAAALIGTMIEIKKWYNSTIAGQAMNRTDEAMDIFGFRSMSASLDRAKSTLDFSPWFYVTVVAFIAAAVFSYLRLRPPGSKS